LSWFARDWVGEIAMLKTSKLLDDQEV